MIRNLADLLFPHDPRELQRAIAGGQRLHLRTERADAFKALMPWERVSGFITMANLQSGRAAIVINGRDLPQEMYSRLDYSSGQRELVPGAVQDLIDKGISLVVNHVEKLSPRIGAAGAMIQRELDVSSGTNLYASFRKSSAFRPHWDAHNVLILQLYGRKHWQCFEPREAFPIEGNVLGKDEDLGEPVWNGVMEPGDVLYLPRGTIHSGKMLDSHSLHLTINITPPRGIDYLRWLAQQAQQSEEFRQDIASIAPGQGLAEQSAQWRQAMHRLVDSYRLEDFFADPKRFPAPHPQVNLGLDEAFLADPWITPGLRKAVGFPQGQPGTVQFGEVSISLSADECTVMHLLMTNNALKRSELQALVPHMTADALIGCLKRLASRDAVYVFDSDRIS